MKIKLNALNITRATLLRALLNTIGPIVVTVKNILVPIILTTITD